MVLDDGPTAREAGGPLSGFIHIFGISNIFMMLMIMIVVIIIMIALFYCHDC